MRHPFDGIIVRTPSTRRSWVKGMLASVAGLFAAGAAQAVAPPSAKVRLVTPSEPNPEPGKPSTDAIGEEGATRARNEAGGKMSTQALREEGGGIATTLAVGEEGAATRALNENGKMTTKALNEEGAVKPVPKPAPKPGTATTLAIGEEG